MYRSAVPPRGAVRPEGLLPMAEAPRPRPVEYYNPRPLILAACFFWGVAMGFCIFYFSPPKQMSGSTSPDAPKPIPNPSRDLTARRNEDVPAVTPVPITPERKASAEPVFKTMVLEPPLPPLTTEGGLTGRTAHSINRQRPQSLSSPAPTVAPPPPVFTAPPPIPELLP